MYTDYGLFIILISIIIGMMAQSNLKSTFFKYSRRESTTSLTGCEVAEKIMHENGIYDVRVELTNGYLGDHFDPRNKVVRLSKENYYGSSIAAQAVAAHEVGHVIQYAQNSVLLKIRTAIFPMAQIGSQIAGPIILIGLISTIPGLLWIGIFCLSLALLFQVATLPVEFDASKRALTQLQSLNIIDQSAISGATDVLKAAAWTYVVGVLVAILQILRLILIARNRD